MRRATHFCLRLPSAFRISIHALLAESDGWWTRSPCCCFHFYPRSPCGERHLGLYLFERAAIISIHALLAESDLWFHAVALAEQRISIHALLAESDAVKIKCPQDTGNFYPRSPCGERRTKDIFTLRINVFLSTLSLRRATVSVSKSLIVIIFLSTLSLRRATGYHAQQAACVVHFYPRSPCGERHFVGDVAPCRSDFYPRSPCGERPHSPAPPLYKRHISIHALLAESDQSL